MYMNIYSKLPTPVMLLSPTLFMLLCSHCFVLFIQYLCNPDERLRWTANSLPTDDLCVENAIMLKRFNRFPLIIDPSGQATTFIENEFREKKITRTR